MSRRVVNWRNTAGIRRIAMLAPAGAWAAAFVVATLAHGGRPAAAGLHVQSSIKDGVYTDAQAARGKKVYTEQCITCHLETLNGTPPLAGEAFQKKWATLTVNDLFTKIRTSMPTTDPGMLEPAEYLDVIAYIFKENKLPAGAQEFKDDPAVLKLSLGDAAPH